MSNIEYELFKNNLLQRPITFLTEENLDKLEIHCRKAIHYERGLEHQVVLELLERHKEHLAEREQDRKRIKELEVLEDDLKDKRVVYIDTPEFAENYIPKQKVKDKIEELKKIKTGLPVRHMKVAQIKILEELLGEK